VDRGLIKGFLGSLLNKMHAKGYRDLRAVGLQIEGLDQEK
jgi:hypothetical protein